MLYFILFVVFFVIFIKIGDLKTRVDLLEGKFNPNKNKAKTLDDYQPIINKTDNITLASDGTINKQNINYTIPVKTPGDVPIKTNKAETYEPVILKEKNSGQSFEFKFGAKFFTIIGSIAITFGVGYFLKYAFDNNLIPEIGRVIIGVVLGIAITTLGIWLSKKYSLFGQVLSGTGLGLIYLSVYSLYGFYSLVPVYVGFAFLIIVTIAGMSLAVYQNLLWMAVFSQIGAYLAPVLLLSNENHPHILFMYIIGIILGTFGVAWFKLWRPLVAVNFVATVILFLTWAANYMTKDMVGIAATYLTIFFILFTSILFINYIVRKVEQNIGDFVLLSLNSMLTFVGYYGVVNYYYHDFMGPLTIAFSAVHFALLLLVKPEGESSLRLKEFLLAIGSILFTISIPILFDSNSVLTIGWSLEAAVLVLFGTRLKSYSLRFIGLVIQLIVLARVIFQDIFNSVHLPKAIAFINERFLTFFLVTVITAFIGWLYYKNKDNVSGGELALIKIAPVLVGIQIFIFGTVEVSDFLANYWLIVFWSIIICGLFIVGNVLKSKGLIVIGYLIMIINFFGFIGIGPVGVKLNAFANPYFSVVFFATIMGIISVLSLRLFNSNNSETSNIDAVSYMSMYSFLALMIAFSKEVVIYEYSLALLPIFWSISAVILLVVSYYFKSKILRFTTYATVLISAIYCLFYVTEILVNSDYYFIFNYRFIAMFVVAIVSLLIIYSLSFEEGIPDEEKKSIGFVFSLAGNILLLVGISQEVWGVMTRQIQSANNTVGLTQFRDVLLSITWAIYGSVIMIFGIYKRSRFSRLFGLILLAAVIFKIFFIDAAGLDTVYKILAYITLGVILLVAGFLYNKYKSRIMEFVK